ncbi:MAG: PIN domain-containing protein [Chloroflexi bacterium]|nr:PIN domain-containing protein [Chloroflexota bacterium]MCC6895340.1 PIN domain-containing protein [Anaerolineae bacterium]
MMGGKTFVDTNVLLRARVKGMEFHHEAKTLIDIQISAGNELWISRQVIREFLVNVTRPQSVSQPMTIAEVEAEMNVLNSVFNIADETANVTAKLLQLIKQYPTGGKQIHDANIVATMLVNDVDTLLTQNMDDMKRFEKEILLIPLKADAKP